ncbi:MAG TPA: hypothetical protein VNL77_13815 [Roseiflexaceae bacterium]|nr:hypothetical protein [Roseiflexaceae bacterium]
MVVMIVQLAIVGLWGCILITHTRRLLRLAQVQVPHLWSAPSRRTKLARLWFWLGREEFWRAVQADGLRCTQLTLMVFLMAWGLLS